MRASKRRMGGNGLKPLLTSLDGGTSKRRQECCFISRRRAIVPPLLGAAEKRFVVVVRKCSFWDTCIIVKTSASKNK